MALSMRNVCLYRTNINFVFINQNMIQLPLKLHSRRLRGSRLGREIDKTEAKFQQLLKTLKDTRKNSLHNSELPETALKVISERECYNVQRGNELVLEDAFKRLESKITPLKKLPYSRQLERKYHKCLSLLRMYGEKLRSIKVPITLGSDKLPCPVELMLPSLATEKYRNQDEFSIGMGLDGNPKTVGYYLDNLSGDSDTVCIGPEDLLIIKDTHKEFIKDFQSYIRLSSLPACLKNQGDGYWKSVCVRSNKIGELMGIVVMNCQSLTDMQLQSEKLEIQKYFESFERGYHLKSLFFQACSASNLPSEQEPCELLYGEPHIIEEVNDVKCQISPQSFFYSNTHSIEAICNALKKFCRVNSATTVIEIFCGTGSISLMFSPCVKNCIGIDLPLQGVKDALQNAELNNKHNIKFVEGNPDAVLEDILYQNYFEDLLVIINLGRNELSKTSLRRLRECKHLKKIVFITSKPRVAVEKFIKLSMPSGKEPSLGKYFVPLFAVPVDLAPQTEHYGLIVMYQRL